MSTRFTVPDLSISSDIESHGLKSIQRQINRQKARFETYFPQKDATQFVSPRQPLKTIPVVNKCNVSKRNEVDVSQMLKQHDQQLQKISRQIEKLLQITSEEKLRPSKCSVETMTSCAWPPDGERIQGANVKKISQSKSKLEKVHEVSVQSVYRETESVRGGEDSDDYYDHIISNIDEMLRSSDSESNESVIESPVMEERIARRKTDRGKREGGHQMSSETLYIKRLASKYLVCESRESPATVKKSSTRPRLQRDLQVYGISHDVSSIATKNYLQKYGLMNRPQDFSPSQGLKTGRKGNRILDLESLKMQQKFR